MQCPVCHTEVGAQSAFCGNCGATLSASAPDVAAPAAFAPPPAAAPAGYPAPSAAAASSGLSPNSAAAISYITIIPAILFLVMDPYKRIPLVRFHAFQCIAMAVGWFAFWIAVVILMTILAFVPGIHLIALFLGPILYFGAGICFFILWLVAILKASKGEWFKIPFLGDIAMKMSQGS